MGAEATVRNSTKSDKIMYEKCNRYGWGTGAMVSTSEKSGMENSKMHKKGTGHKLFDHISCICRAKIEEQV